MVERHGKRLELLFLRNGEPLILILEKKIVKNITQY